MRFLFSLGTRLWVSRTPSFYWHPTKHIPRLFQARHRSCMVLYVVENKNRPIFAYYYHDSLRMHTIQSHLRFSLFLFGMTASNRFARHETTTRIPKLSNIWCASVHPQTVRTTYSRSRSAYTSAAWIKSENWIRKIALCFLLKPKQLP